MFLWLDVFRKQRWRLYVLGQKSISEFKKRIDALCRAPDRSTCVDVFWCLNRGSPYSHSHSQPRSPTGPSLSRSCRCPSRTLSRNLTLDLFSPSPPPPAPPPPSPHRLRRGAAGSAEDLESMLGWVWAMRKAAGAGGLLLARAALTYTDLGRRAIALMGCSGLALALATLR